MLKKIVFASALAIASLVSFKGETGTHVPSMTPAAHAWPCPFGGNGC